MRRRRLSDKPAMMTMTTLMMIMVVLLLSVCRLQVVTIFVVHGFSITPSTTTTNIRSTRGSLPRLQHKRLPQSSSVLFSTSATRVDRTALHLASSSTTSSSTTSAAITVIDPCTQCEVVLLGCFHGTKSSADDVARLIDDDTDVIVLELCTSRFADLRRQQEKLHRQAQDEGNERGNKSQQINSESWRRAITSSWPVRYGQTVSATFAKKGVATGVAALLLTGVSGLQSAMSGFQPGLEFTTALERGQQLNCDIVLADQDVDETLRKLGSIPVDVWKNMLLLHNKKSSIVHNKDENINYNSLFEESVYHLKTLTRAVFGDSGDSTVPQVRAFPVLVRNGAAVRDLVRLVIPSLVTIVVSSQIFGLIIGSAADWSFAVLADDTIAAANVFSSEHQNTISGVDDVSGSWAVHVLASSCILLSGFLSMAPIIKVILTERDAVLTEGILSACQRAGNGGRVVAVLGLLHVNGVANRIMASGETSNDDNANP